MNSNQKTIRGGSNPHPAIRGKILSYFFSSSSRLISRFRIENVFCFVFCFFVGHPSKKKFNFFSGHTLVGCLRKQLMTCDAIVKEFFNFGPPRLRKHFYLFFGHPLKKNGLEWLLRPSRHHNHPNLAHTNGFCPSD